MSLPESGVSREEVPLAHAFRVACIRVYGKEALEAQMGKETARASLKDFTRAILALGFGDTPPPDVPGAGTRVSDITYAGAESEPSETATRSPAGL